MLGHGKTNIIQMYQKSMFTTNNLTKQPFSETINL